MIKPSRTRRSRGPASSSARRSSASGTGAPTDDRAARARREERSARPRRCLLCGLLKILPVFILVLPGLIARALYPDIGGDEAYPTLVIRLLPPGLIGFIVAALMAALMSSLAATFNSASTLVTFDVYKKLSLALPRSSSSASAAS